MRLSAKEGIALRASATEGEVNSMLSSIIQRRSTEMKMLNQQIEYLQKQHITKSLDTR
jgi:hypothetical protein